MHLVSIDLLNQFRTKSLYRIALLALWFVTPNLLAQTVEDELAAIEALQVEQDEIDDARYEMDLLAHLQHRESASTMFASTPDVSWHLDSNQCAIPLQIQTKESSGTGSARHHNYEYGEAQSGGITGDLSPRQNLSERVNSSASRSVSQYEDGYVYNTTHHDLTITGHPNNGLATPAHYVDGVVKHLPFVISSNQDGMLSVVEMRNTSSLTDKVVLVAIDDVGTMFGPFQFELEANDIMQFTTQDLEEGNAALGLSGIGRGVGDWRIRLESELPTELSHRIQNAEDEFPMEFGGEVISRAGVFHVFGFRAGDGVGESSLRIVNQSNEIAVIVVESLDTDANERGKVSLTLGPEASTLLSASELSRSSHLFQGFLNLNERVGNLQISSETQIVVQHLWTDSSGKFSNISRSDVFSNDSIVLTPLSVDRIDTSSKSSLVEYYNPNLASEDLSIQVLSLEGEVLSIFDATLNPASTFSISSADLWHGNAHLGIRRVSELSGDFVYLKATALSDIRVRSLARNSESSYSTLQQSQAVDPSILTSLEIQEFDDTKHEWHLTNPSPSDVNILVHIADGLTESIHVKPYGTKVVDQSLFYNTTNEGEVEGPLTIQIQPDSILSARYFVRTTDSLFNLTPIQEVHRTESRILDEDVTARQHFADHIYEQVLRARCMNCHIRGGRSQNTRLVFVGTNENNHEERNFQILTSFFDDIQNGANYLLGKVRGQGHGGGRQFSRNSEEYQALEKLIELHEQEKNQPDPEPDPPEPPPLTATELVDFIELEPASRTLWKAALIMAGRIPSQTEYDMLDGSEESLRSAIRSLLVGKGFEEFLRRSAHDQFSTSRDRFLLDRNDGHFVNYTNSLHEMHARDGENKRLAEFWDAKVQFGIRSEPAELIVYLALNDKPYTEILDADYVLANPYSASVYGGETKFDNEQDHLEFKPVRIADYFLKCEDFAIDSTEFGPYVSDRGSCQPQLPLAGVLTSKAILQSVPSTASNRNRARANWVHKYLLGVDIHDSASLVVDRESLVDSNLPTLRNLQCTECHSQLDPVAGAFQDYDELGLFRSRVGGMSSLPDRYRNPAFDSNEFTKVTARGVSSIAELAVEQYLMADEIELLFEVQMNPDNEPQDQSAYTANVGLAYVQVMTPEGVEIDRFDASQFEVNDGSEGIRILRDDANEIIGLSVQSGHHVDIPLRLRNAGFYRFELGVWEDESSEAGQGNALVRATPEYFFRSGDTWFRDMLAPGFGDDRVPDSEQSALQWLAKQIKEDERFARASVEFWWSAVFGRSLLRPPADEKLPDFAALKLGVEAERLEAKRLADGWREGFGSGTPFSLRDLLTELAMSRFFRATQLTDEVTGEATKALSQIGMNRMLRPSELAAKIESLTGLKWRATGSYRASQPPEDYETSHLESQSGGRSFYGSANSDDTVLRLPEFSSVASNTALGQALEMSCPIVYREFYLLDQDRRQLFGGIDLWDSTVPAFGEQISVENADEMKTYSVTGNLPAGDAEISVQLVNHSTNNMNELRVLIGEISLTLGGQKVWQMNTFDSDMSVEEESCATGGEELAFTCNGIVKFNLSLNESGIYALELQSRGDGIVEYEPKLNLTVKSSVSSTLQSDMVVRAKLVELHSKMLGREVEARSTAIDDRLEFLKAALDRSNQNDITNFNRGERCDYWAGDYRYLVGIAADAVTRVDDVHGGHRKVVNGDSMSTLWEMNGSGDPLGMANAWSLVLASYLFDYEFLHF